MRQTLIPERTLKLLSANTGSGSVDTITLDLLNYQAAAILICVSALSAGRTITATIKHTNNADGSGTTAISGGTLSWSSASSNWFGIFELTKPAKRYLLVSFTRSGGESTIEAVLGQCRQQVFGSTITDSDFSTYIYNPTDA